LPQLRLLFVFTRLAPTFFESGSSGHLPDLSDEVVAEKLGGVMVRYSLKGDFHFESVRKLAEKRLKAADFFMKQLKTEAETQDIRKVTDRSYNPEPAAEKDFSRKSVRKEPESNKH
jgi:hypothetical protein